MYLPAELRGQGLSLNLTLFAQRRFGLDLRYPDFCDRRIELPIMIADGNDVVLDRIDANPTHDGHFLAAVPIGPNRLTIGLLKSEEHTSELQSLMRISYAVFCLKKKITKIKLKNKHKTTS